MGMGNIGIGLSSAIQGFSQGMQLGRQFRGLRDEKEIRDTTKQGMADAQSQRQADINGMIQTTDLGGGAQQFKVGDQSFTNRADAEKAAGQHIGSTIDYFNKTVAPKIQQQYIDQGNMDMANKWQSYTQDAATQRGMRSYVQALRARAMGDDKGALQHLVDAYNDDGYFNDGTKITGYDEIKNSKGDVIGHTATFTGPDGKTYSQDYKEGDLSSLVNMGIGLLSPDKAFAATLQQQQAADKARGEMAAASAKEGLQQAGRIQLQGVKSRDARQLASDKAGYDSHLQSQRDNAADNRQILGIQMNTAAAGQRRAAELQADNDALIGLGVSPADAAAAVQRRVAGGSQSTKDMGAQAWDAVSRNDPSFSTMSDAERADAVRRDIVGRQAASQAARGIVPQAAGQAPAPTRAPVYDPATGQIR